MEAAAGLAAAALLDTLAACRRAFGADRCRLALAGDLTEGVRADELRAALAGWTVVPQRGEDFAARLVEAHESAARDLPGPVVQIGMDTPQVTERMLLDAAEALEEHDGVLGPAEDGGWWVLGLRDPAQAAAIRDVPMSTRETGAATRTALERAGLRVAGTATLRDVDTLEDARLVAQEAPDGAFAAAWAELAVAR
ncbi:DUF2064 domain-containing protein [Nocardioides sp. MJB4]|uniref:DUF2064 domain-containing protein n=2 Tax=Nocardioides donggukensis TaxID=2774019 RepID=A0A927K443_9ACTN|nr:DUF2064 domain-containing protein [Nocardioides donggukensis]